MKRRVGLYLLILAVAAAPWFLFGRHSGPTYHGRTAAQWESEIRQWYPVAYGNPMASWFRHASWWEVWLGRVNVSYRVRSDRPPALMPLLAGDAEAMPVLVELLSSPDADARALAAQGLREIEAAAGKDQRGPVE